MQGVTAWELPMWHAINRVWVHPWLDSFMVRVTSNETWIVVAIVLLTSTLLFYRFRSAMKLLIVTAMAISLTDGISFYALKPLFQRLRPCYEWSNEVRILVIRCGSDYGFPSNHAANSAAIALALFLVIRQRWCLVVGLPLAFVVSYSRAYVGVHYPTDTIAGMCFGAAMAWGVATASDGLIALRRARIDSAA